MLLIDLAVLFIITGLIVDVLSSLFGLGGGLTIVPVMTFYLGVSDIVPKGYVIHIAVATSLFVMIFTSLASTYTRYRSKDIRWPDTRPLGIGVLVGAIIGAIKTIDKLTPITDKIIEINNDISLFMHLSYTKPPIIAVNI